ncbi:intradiol ring-cleavage dioxygenase [Ascoidea rubescens DSM 1968]|uniref:Aromatic compound dioxygenase n=1 Tax=Ascoidea rubescens DSM 1968 TaxID=1344418 RepID=A0A1D2VH63_9ASCO|nr:aromatic compound dioxygenase [Ascoidea rubescens DSM 1968]ODV60932.1 aromatic compound dioxygenase [Ascoidea rubescens DSM 1968]
MSQEFTDFVISSMGPKTTPRARCVIGSLIQHIHDFTRENYITVDEWLYGVDFINKIGHMSDERRNEGILVSDVLGLETLVDIQTHKLDHVKKTSSAIIGPFYRPNSPLYRNGESIIQKEVGGVKAFVHGRITDPEGKPLPGAKVEVWHCAPNGLYEQQDDEQPDYNLRGTFIADEQGYYSYTCLRPTSYPIPYDGPAGDLLQFMDRHPNRPSHIHWRVSYPEYHDLITQIYDSECPYTKDDSVFAVKEDCIVNFTPIDNINLSTVNGHVKSLDELKAKDIEVELYYDISLPLESEMQKDRKKVEAKQVELERAYFEKYAKFAKNVDLSSIIEK